MVQIKVEASASDLIRIQLVVPPMMTRATGMTQFPPPWMGAATGTGRPKEVGHTSPFTAPSLATQPVLTVQHLLRAGREIILNLNPSLAAARDPSGFPLISDMRVLPELKVWKIAIKDGSKKVEDWKGPFTIF